MRCSRETYMENAKRESSDRTLKTGRSLRSRKPEGQQPTAGAWAIAAAPPRGEAAPGARNRPRTPPRDDVPRRTPPLNDNARSTPATP